MVTIACKHCGYEFDFHGGADIEKMAYPQRVKARWRRLHEPFPDGLKLIEDALKADPEWMTGWMDGTL